MTIKDSLQISIHIIKHFWLKKSKNLTFPLGDWCSCLILCYLGLRVCSWQKMTSVRFCKKVRFLVWFYKINCSFGLSVRFFPLCVV